MALQDIDVSVTVPNVEGWLEVLNNYADDAISSANQVAGQLGATLIPGYYPNVTFNTISPDVTLGALGTKPTKPVINANTRVAPTSPDITIPAVNTTSAPIFSEADPSITLPSVPSPLDAILPVKDFTVDLTTSFPLAPDTVLPEAPTLVGLSLPTPQSLNLPTFSLDFPTSTSLLVPSTTFSFSQEKYSSSLLTKVKDELLKRVGGGSGITPIVEQAIWDRGRDREIRNSQLAQYNLLASEASRGFTRPTGSTLSQLSNLVQEAQSKINDLSRDVMIKQAELEQENIKTSIQQAISLEDILIRDNNEMVQRAFEVAKYTQDLAVEIFKIQVSKYNSEVEAYKAFSVAYQARVQAELSKIEIFKAQLDAEKIKNEINDQNIRIYLARIEGVKANVEVYKSLISAISERLRAEALKVEVYKTDVEAYSEVVKAKAAEFSNYSEQIKGELSKTQIFDSKVKAYATKVQAYAAESDIKIKKAEIESGIQELKIKSYQAALEAFIKQVQSDQLLYQTAVDIYKGEAQLYLADVGVKEAVASLELKQIDSSIQQNKYSADIAIANAQIALESIKSAYTTVIEAKKSAGSIYQSIGASALNAINVSASLNGSVGISASESHDYNTSI